MSAGHEFRKPDLLNPEAVQVQLNAAKGDADTKLPNETLVTVKRNTIQYFSLSINNHVLYHNECLYLFWKGDFV